MAPQRHALRAIAFACLCVFGVFRFAGTARATDPQLTITTVAGGGVNAPGDEDQATSADLAVSDGVALDVNGNLIVAETGGHRLRRVDWVTGIITTVAGTGTAGFSGDGGPAAAAELAGPSGVVVDSDGSIIFADRDNHRIRRIDAATGIIDTIAGTGATGGAGDDGPAIGAQVDSPEHIALDGAGNLLVSDSTFNRVRRIDRATGTISTIAGGGSGADGGSAIGAALLAPAGLATDVNGNLFIVERQGRRIRRVDAQTGLIATVAGTGAAGYSGDGGLAADATLSAPQGLAIGVDGALFVADTGNHVVRRIDATTGVITAFAGMGSAGFAGDGGAATDAMLNGPIGLAISPVGGLYVADSGNEVVRRVGSADVASADAGPDQTLEATGPAGATVTLDGSASSDPNGAALTYQWRDANGAVVGHTATLTLTVPLGTTSFSLSVTNGGQAATDTVGITVQDTTAPALSVPADMVIAATGPSGAAVNYTITAPDLASEPVTITCSPESGTTFPKNETWQVSCEAADTAGNIATGAFMVTVVNATPTAVADAYTVIDHTVLSVDAVTGVLANDIDPDDFRTSLVATLVSGPSQGSLDFFPDGHLTYEPNGGYFGPDSFEYTVTDPSGAVSAVQTVSVTVAPRPPTIVLPAGIGPTHRWSFDEHNGASVYDAGVQVAPVTGTMSTGNGEFSRESRYTCAAQTSGAMRVSGGARVELDPWVGEFGTADFTLSAWFKSSSGFEQTLLANLDTDTQNGLSLRLVGDRLKLDLYQIVVEGQLPAGGADGQWHHAVARRQGTVATLFFDGQPVASLDDPAVATSILTPDNVTLGSQPHGGYALNGVLDEIRIYYSAINDQQVSDLYRSMVDLDSNGQCDATPTEVTATTTAPGVAAVQPSFFATDFVDGVSTPVCTPADFNAAVGDTTISCSFTTSSNVTVTREFHVHVDERPAPKAPEYYTVATDPTGYGDSQTASVNFISLVAPTGTVTYQIDNGPLQTVAIASGRPRAILASGPITTGVHTISWTYGGDYSYLPASGSFIIEGPSHPDLTISVPADISVPATSAAGANVSFTAEGSNEIDGLLPVVCSPGGSGALFPIGSTLVTCTVTDRGGNTASASFTITVSGAAVSADSQGVSLNEDGTVSITLTASGGGGPLSFNIVTGPAKGSLSTVGGSVFTYTPNSNEFGADSFTFRASDGAFTSNLATVSITINPVNDAPSFTKGANQTVAPGANPINIPGWATNVSPGPANEGTQTVNFIVSNNNTGLFLTQPAVSSNGALSFALSGAVGTATVAVSIHDNGGTANGGVDTSAAQTFTITVAKSNQTITFGLLPNRTFGDPDFALTATASSGLTVSYAASGACSVSGNTVHLTGAAACAITASQAGNAGVNAAGDVIQSFSIAKATTTTTVTCAPASVVYTGAPQQVCAASVAGFALSATATVAYTDNVNAGTATATASYDGNANYLASSGSATFTITAAPQVITFAAIANQSFGAPDFLVSATSDAGLDVSFAASGACTISAGTVHLVTAGTCTITASQAGTANYSAAAPVVRAFSVLDVVAPVVTVPADLFLEATSASGAVVAFNTTAFDDVVGAPVVTCSAQPFPVVSGGPSVAAHSGDTLPLGTSLITCSATDGVNVGSASFQVTVRDTIAPDLTVADITASATTAAGVSVSFAPTAVDIVSGSIAATCSPTSATVFAIGDTTVTCSATDAAGNSATKTFVVHVLDAVPPSIVTPTVTPVEATSPSGAAVSFTVSASDNIDGIVSATCLPASGLTFAVGTTTVQCSAHDAANNNATATFDVVVRDTTAPTLSLTNATATLTSGTTTTVTFMATANDIVDGARAVTCSPASGSAFPIGATTVACASSDTRGNNASGTLTVTVLDGAAPTVTVPGPITVEAASAAGAVVTFSAGAADNYSQSLTATCVPASGSTFPIGQRTVNCSAADAAGNTGSAAFSVTVVDTTAPALTLPASITATATSPAGAAVTFSTSAVDLVDGALPVTCTPASGSTFVPGTTTVDCRATDSRGNVGRGSFVVTVNRTSNGLGQFVVFSQDATWLRNGTTVVTGDVGANEPRDVSRRQHDDNDNDDDEDDRRDGRQRDVTVHIGASVKMLDPNSRVVGNVVQLLNKASVWDVLHNGLINRRGIIRGDVTTPVALPYLAMPAFPTVSAGTQRVAVVKKKTLTLAAGSYGDVTVDEEGTLVLTGGLYQMRSLQVSEKARVVLRGASEVRILTELDTRAKAQIVLDQSVANLSASQMVFFVAGRDADCRHNHGGDGDGDGARQVTVHIGEQNVIQAVVYAKDGTVWLKSQTQATGQFIGEHVRVGERVTLNLAARFQ